MITALFALPAVLLILGLVGGWVGALTLLAIVTSAFGVVIERWLHGLGA